MNIHFEKNFYLEAIKENNNFNDEKEIFNYAKEKLQFKYGNITFREFNEKYSVEGWFGRKVTALPTAIQSVFVKAIYHLSKLIFIGFPKAFYDEKNYLKTQFFMIIRDLQTTYGHLLSIFNDKHGQFHVQESQFQKDCYECFIARAGEPVQNLESDNNKKLQQLAESIIQSFFSEGIPDISQNGKENSSGPVNLWDYFETCIGCSFEKEEIRIPNTQDSILVPKLLVAKFSQPLSLDSFEKRVVQLSDCSIVVDPLTQELLCLESKFFRALWRGSLKESSAQQVTDLKRISFKEFKDILSLYFIRINLSNLAKNKESVINLLRQYFNLIETSSFLELESHRKGCLLTFNHICLIYQEPDIEVSQTVKEIWENANHPHFPFPSVARDCEKFLAQQLEKFIEADSASFAEMVKLCEGVPIKKLVLTDRNFVGSCFKELSLLSSLEEIKLRRCEKFQEANLIYLANLPLKTIKLVRCEWFKDVSLLKDATHLEKLKITRCPSFTGKGLVHLKTLKSLDLSYCEKLDEDELRNLKDLPLLESLEIEFYRGSLAAFTEYQTLKSLKLRRYEGARSEFAYLKSIPLEYLNLDGGDGKTFLVHLKDLPLKELHVFGLEDPVEDVTHLQSMSHLEKLSIESVEALTYVGENLKELFLCPQDSQDKDLAVLEKFSQLEKLTLIGDYDTKLTGACFDYLNSDHIQELSLINCKQINDNCLKHIAKTCPHLSKLIFDNCSITGEGLAFLANMQIQELTLKNCKQLKGECFIHFKNLPHLKALNLVGHKFDANHFSLLKGLPVEKLTLSEDDLAPYFWDILPSLHTMGIKFNDSLFSFMGEKEAFITSIGND